MDMLEQSMALEEAAHEGDAENFVEIIDPDGSKRKIRKSTFVWLLMESKDKLSSDRLKRVQRGPQSNKKKGKRFKNLTPT